MSVFQKQVTNPADFGRVALLMGGFSAEREISLNSGAAVHAAMQRLGIDVDIVDPQDDDLICLLEEDYDRAFIILHGRGGEDGEIQGFLETADIPYTGSGVTASAIGMNKRITKQQWQVTGLPTPYWTVAEQVDEELLSKLPLMVKPAAEGSSIGMSRVNTESQLDEALSVAAEYDADIVVEQWIDGQEYTVAILNGQALPMIRMETPNDFYDFEAKYQSNDTGYHCPCGLSPEKEREVAELALDAFEEIGCTGWGRVDLMIDNDGAVWLLEVNTVPGMTGHSLVPMAAAAAGISFDDLVWLILESSLSED